MRRIRKNPLFDYKAFASEREEFLDLLYTYFEDVEEDAIEQIKSLLSPYSDAFSLLRYSTPFYFEVLVDSFSKIMEDEFSKYADHDDSSTLAGAILDIDHNDLESVYAGWLADQTIHLYKIVNDKDSFTTTLNLLVERYNKQKGTEAISFTFPEHILDADKFKEEMVDCLLCEERDDSTFDFDMDLGDLFKIDTDSGFLGVLCAYFLASQISSVTSKNISNALFFVRQCTHQNSSADFILNSDMKMLIDFFDLNKTPFWVSSIVEIIDFFNVGVHYTQLMFEDGVTPTNLRTKLVDYTQGAFVTHGRDLPTVTKAESQRALIYCWRIEHLKDDHYSKKDKYADHPSAYGDNFIFIFTNAILTFVKVGDWDTQSVCLLQDVVETIPFYAKERYDIEDCFAYFGLSEDGERPLFEVDLTDWSRKKENFAYYVYEVLCQYLCSTKYKPEHNINQTISPGNR